MPPVVPVVVAPVVPVVVVPVPDPVVNVLPFAFGFAFCAKMPASEESSRRSAPEDPVPVVVVVVPVVLVPVVVPVPLVVICAPVRFKVNGLGLGITPGGNFGPTPGCRGAADLGPLPWLSWGSFGSCLGTSLD